jgi:hypothetical protein
MHLAIAIIVGLAVLHLLGGAHHHRRHYRRTGLHPSLRYTYGMGWWGSIRLPGGFRIGHRLP